MPFSDPDTHAQLSAEAKEARKERDDKERGLAFQLAQVWAALDAPATSGDAASLDKARPSGVYAMLSRSWSRMWVTVGAEHPFDQVYDCGNGGGLYVGGVPDASTAASTKPKFKLVASCLEREEENNDDVVDLAAGEWRLREWVQNDISAWLEAQGQAMFEARVTDPAERSKKATREAWFKRDDVKKAFNAWRAVDGVKLVRAPIVDCGSTGFTHKQAEEACGQIIAAMKAGQAALVHCAKGRGRSVMLAALALMKGQFTYEVSVGFRQDLRVHTMFSALRTLFTEREPAHPGVGHLDFMMEEQLLNLLDKAQDHPKLSQYLECVDFMKGFYDEVIRPIADKALSRTDWSCSIKGDLLPALSLADSLVRTFIAVDPSLFASSGKGMVDFLQGAAIENGLKGWHGSTLDGFSIKSNPLKDRVRKFAAERVHAQPYKDVEKAKEALDGCWTQPDKSATAAPK